MKKITLASTVAIFVFVLASCTQSVGDKPVTPDSWKGLDFIVRDTVTKVETHYIDTVWDASHSSYTLKANTSIVPKPGNQLRAIAVRSAEGQNCGIYASPSSMTLYLTERDVNGLLVKDTVDGTFVCNYYDLNHFNDPYATFKLPLKNHSSGNEIDYIETADVDVYLVYNAYGTYVDRTGVTKHEEPYLGGLETTSLISTGGTTVSYPTTGYHYKSSSIQIYRR